MRTVGSTVRLLLPMVTLQPPSVTRQLPSVPPPPPDCRPLPPPNRRPLHPNRAPSLSPTNSSGGGGERPGRVSGLERPSQFGDRAPPLSKGLRWALRPGTCRSLLPAWVDLQPPFWGEGTGDQPVITGFVRPGAARLCTRTTRRTRRPPERRSAHHWPVLRDRGGSPSLRPLPAPPQQHHWHPNPLTWC